jgi:thiamine biosynthesis protein ThiS
MIEIKANGDRYQLTDSCLITDFLQQNNLEIEKVVIEYNGSPLTRSEAKDVRLKAGDQLEIVRIVAGG